VIEGGGKPGDAGRKRVNASLKSEKTGRIKRGQECDEEEKREETDGGWVKRKR